jgi:hypothetical protein
MYLFIQQTLPVYLGQVLSRHLKPLRELGLADDPPNLSLKVLINGLLLLPLLFPFFLLLLLFPYPSLFLKQVFGPF